MAFKKGNITLFLREETMRPIWNKKKVLLLICLHTYDIFHLHKKHTQFVVRYIFSHQQEQEKLIKR